MNEATNYYETHFGPQLVKVATADRGWQGRISLVSLIPGAVHATPGQARAFSSLEEKHGVMFLMCYFFSALLDQAIQSGLRDEHDAFDRLARYPKLVGILSSAHSNLHPAHLLVAVTVQMQTLSAETVVELFETMTAFMANEYVRFLTTEYPAYTTHLQSAESRARAVHTIFREVVRATTPPDLGLWRYAFTLGTTPADWLLADRMIRICNQVFSDRLAVS